MSPIRLAVDAVIERQGAILLVEFEDSRFGRHYGLPGGGVEPGETMHEAVRREAWEETGAEVIVGPLLLVNEYQPEKYANLYDDQQEIRLVFHCQLREDRQLVTPLNPDEDQLGTAWVLIEQLPSIRLFPRIGQRLFAILTTLSRYDLFNTEL
jgi:ADP-ribose pyrophosphatase YjhB (NUDIX family)